MAWHANLLLASPSALRLHGTFPIGRLMSAIQCVCGEIIPDRSDGLPHKGYLIADEDILRYYNAVWAAMDALAVRAKDASLSDGSLKQAIWAAQDAATDAEIRFSRVMYQCPACARLWVEGTDSSYREFVPVDPAAAPGVLRSSERGEQPTSVSSGQGAD